MKRKLVLFLIALMVLSFTKFVFAFDDGDMQYRFASCLSKQFNKDWQAYFYSELNLGDDAGRLYSHVYEPGIVYSGLAKWFDLSFAYVRVESKSGDKWSWDNIYYLAGYLKASVLKVDLNNKMRLEYDNRETLEDRWRYRNLMTLTFPLKLTRFEIQPYLSDEVFYDFDAECLTRNEFSSGFNFKITKNLSAAVFYLLAHDYNNLPDNSYWQKTHLVGTKVAVSF